MLYDLITYKKFGSSSNTSVAYSLLQPNVFKIQKPDGHIKSVRYGIGETLYVLEPKTQTLAALSERLDKIPLIDGSFIVEWDDATLKTNRVYREPS